MVDYKTFDPDLWAAIAKEEERQEHNLELIASENFVSEAVMAAQGSILTNKYAEGYPGHRYYGGCEFVDIVENLAIDRAKNYSSEICERPASLRLSSQHGCLSRFGRTRGHDLRNGSFRRRTSNTWITSQLQWQNLSFVAYGVDPTTEVIDYNVVRILARKHQPN